MTSNQIAYGQLQETIRNNKRVNELELNKLRETQRHNVSSEYTANVNAQEQIRHNKAGEYNAFATLQETSRHNQRMEELQDSYQSEINRHNTVTESQGWTQVNSQAALNYANANLAQSNVGVAALQTQYNYELGLGNLSVNQTNASINQQNADTREGEARVDARYKGGKLAIDAQDAQTRKKAQQTQQYQGWFNAANGFFNNVIKSGVLNALGG